MSISPPLLLVLASLASHGAWACEIDSAFLTVRFEQAKVILEARVDAVGEDTVTVTPGKIHKGRVPGKQLEIRGPMTKRGPAMMCGAFFPQKGITYLFFLNDQASAGATWETYGGFLGIVEISEGRALLKLNGVSAQ